MEPKFEPRISSPPPSPPVRERSPHWTLLDPEILSPDAWNIPLDILPFAQIPILRGTENWQEWHRAISGEFSNQGVWDHVEGRAGRSFNPNEGDRRLDKSLRTLLGMTLEKTIWIGASESEGIHEMYQYLVSKYKPRPTFSQLVKKLSSLHINDFQNATAYSQEFFATFLEMHEIHPAGVADSMVNALFLEGLGPEWEDFRNAHMENSVFTDEWHQMGINGLLMRVSEEDPGVWSPNKRRRIMDTIRD